MGFPYTAHAGLAYISCFRHGACAPVCGVVRFALRGHINDASNGIIVDSARSAGTRSVLPQSIQAAVEKSASPTRHLLRGNAEFLKTRGGSRRMIRERSTTRAGSDRARACCCSTARSSGLSSTCRATRIAQSPIMRLTIPNKRYYFQRTTLAYCRTRLDRAFVGESQRGHAVSEGNKSGLDPIRTAKGCHATLSDFRPTTFGKMGIDLAKWRWQAAERLKVWCARRGLLLVFYRNGDRRQRLRRFLEIRDTRPFLLDASQACQLICALQATARVPGDVAEVGVAFGASARMIAEYAGDRVVHLFDTFEGLPAPETGDASRFEAGQFECSLADVQAYLGNLRVVFHKGLFPASAESLQDKRFSFVHLDVDLYRSTYESLEWYYPRMSTGGIIVTHDYLSAEGVHRAFAEFFRDKPEPVIELAGDQGMVVKTN
jgi:O-methyltransferase